MGRRLALSLALVLLVAACAAPRVDQAAATFDEADYTSDLNLCRGGNFLMASARTIGLTLLGSAYGAVEGAHYGAHEGDTAEGAAIGAVIGGTIGLTAGALQALEHHEAEIAGCLAEKGYVVIGSIGPPTPAGTAGDRDYFPLRQGR